MTTPDWIRLAVPFIAFALGVVSARILDYLRRERAIVAWSVLAENELLPKGVAEDIELPVRVLVGNEPHESLSLLLLRIGSAGQKVLRDVRISVQLNAGARILRFRPVHDLGEYGEHILVESMGDRIRINLGHLNPEHRTLDFELMVGNYEPGSLTVDLAAPGVRLQRKDPFRWDVPSGFGGLSASILGLRYDPTVAPLTTIATELGDLRRILSAGASLTRNYDIHSDITIISGEKDESNP